MKRGSRGGLLEKVSRLVEEDHEGVLKDMLRDAV